jgi:hypothetical protein
LTGFSTGIDLAFLLIGLITGAIQRTDGENMVASNVQVTQSSSRLVSNNPKLAILEIMSPLYIATEKPPSRHTSLGKSMPTTKSNRLHTVAWHIRKKRTQTEQSQVIWALTVAIKPS